MSAILLTAKEFATSKKFLMAVAGTVVAAAAKIGLELPTETVGLLMAPIITYLLSQGWADHGKEAAKIAGTVKLATETSAEPAQAVKDKLI